MHKSLKLIAAGALVCLALMSVWHNALSAETPLRFDMYDEWIQTGYTGVEEDTIYTPELGYGWDEPVYRLGHEAVAGNRLSDLLRDAHRHHAERVFSVDLEEGWYTVRVYFYDPEEPVGSIRLLAENGVVLPEIHVPRGTAVAEEFTVYVSDGQLNLRFGNAARGQGEWIVCGLDVEPGSAPVADAGTAQVVFDQTILDGSGSGDADGAIVSYEWTLRHKVNPGPDITATGANPVVSGLEPGFYDATLTVTDNDGKTGTDTVLLAVSGPCPWPQPNASFKVYGFAIEKQKGSNKAFAEIAGEIDLGDLSLSPENMVESRITIELFDALRDGSDVIASDEVPLK